MTPAELCLYYVSPMLYRATTQKIIADSHLWALRDNYSELRAENDHLRNALNTIGGTTEPATTFYENAIWRLHDLMDDIREAQNDGNLSDAADLAYEARPLFQLFPDQPDNRTYAEKSRAELIATGKFTGEEIDAIRAQLTHNPHFQRTDTP